VQNFGVPLQVLDMFDQSFFVFEVVGIKMVDGVF
jgi:hypothetical protein